jgi:hypothetical protein
MQQRLQTTPKRNASIKVKALINNCKPGEKNAPGLASLKGTRAVIGALRKFLNVLLVCFGHFLWLHLELLLRFLGYDGRTLGLRSCMMRCISAHEKGASGDKLPMNMLACKVDERDLL